MIICIFIILMIGMLILIFVFLLSISYGEGIDSRSCPRYIESGEFNKSFDTKNACLDYVFKDMKMVVNLRKCPDDLVCDVSAWKGKPVECTKYYTTPKRYPGEYCENGVECYSQICDKNNRCQRSLNISCKDYDCDVGYYCLDGYCLLAAGENQTCDQRKKCKANLVCDMNKCVKIGSKEIGATAKNPFACKTFYIEENVCKKGFSLCKKSVPGLGICRYRKDTGEVFEIPPLCGVNEEGTKYCKLGQKDVNLEAVLCINNDSL